MNNTARGIRNNNPGNIRNSDAIDWKGEVNSKDKKDKAFEEFKTMPDGIRAMTSQPAAFTAGRIYLVIMSVSVR